MNNISSQADTFVANDHFNADAIDAKRTDVQERFDGLQTPLAAREAKLNDALLLQQLIRFAEMVV